jgi:hypothetical protein
MSCCAAVHCCPAAQPAAHLLPGVSYLVAYDFLQIVVFAGSARFPARSGARASVHVQLRVWPRNCLELALRRSACSRYARLDTKALYPNLG